MLIAECSINGIIKERKFILSFCFYLIFIKYCRSYDTVRLAHKLCNWLFIYTALARKEAVEANVRKKAGPMDFFYLPPGTQVLPEICSAGELPWIP